MKKLTILGSTGSIGTQALEIVDIYKNEIEVYALAAGNNIKLLAEQIIKYNPKVVYIKNESNIKQLLSLLGDYKNELKILHSDEGLIEISSLKEIDIVLNALVGMTGIKPTIEAIKAGSDIAIANKESLVCAGHIIMELAKNRGVNIYPVDSEHSAIFQCLNGSMNNKINKIILTASGGPFLNKNKDELKKVCLEDALKHPNWSMGKKITIDSSTMVNKGLEVIEAAHLFNIDVDKIEVLIQPQSIIHSMVEFCDGAVMAQLGTPDMKVPISYALFYPERKILNNSFLDFYKISEIKFQKPDFETFEGLSLAFEAFKKGGTMPAAYNISNEIAVEKFLNNQISYLDITEYIKKGMSEHSFNLNPCVEDIYKLKDELKGILN